MTFHSSAAAFLQGHPAITGFNRVLYFFFNVIFLLLPAWLFYHANRSLTLYSEHLCFLTERTWFSVRPFCVVFFFFSALFKFKTTARGLQKWDDPLCLFHTIKTSADVWLGPMFQFLRSVVKNWGEFSGAFAKSQRNICRLCSYCLRFHAFVLGICSESAVLQFQCLHKAFCMKYSWRKRKCGDSELRVITVHKVASLGENSFHSSLLGFFSLYFLSPGC